MIAVQCMVAKLVQSEGRRSSTPGRGTLPSVFGNDKAAYLEFQTVS